MLEVFDRFFEDQFLGFGKPTLLYYNTNFTQDMNPAYWEKQEIDGKCDVDVYRATVRSVGVSKNDVSIKVKGNQIDIGGKTITNGIDYDFACSLPIADAIVKSIDKITYDTVNGITYLYLYVKKSKDNNIRIEKM
jgi:hypothetical protein